MKTFFCASLIYLKLRRRSAEVLTKLKLRFLQTFGVFGLKMSLIYNKYFRFHYNIHIVLLNIFAYCDTIIYNVLSPGLSVSIKNKQDMCTRPVQICIQAILLLNLDKLSLGLQMKPVRNFNACNTFEN
jgi:hypothetical protein